MNYAQAEKMLKGCGQEHVLAYWKKLSKKEQDGLLEQIAKIEPKSVKYCQEALKKGGDKVDSSKGKAPKVAELRGLSLEELERVTDANAARFAGLTSSPASTAVRSSSAVGTRDAACLAARSFSTSSR